MIKQYVQFVDVDNEQNPFVIQNTSSRLPYDTDTDIEDPTDDELSAPGLIIQPRFMHDVQEEKFWHNISSAYVGQALPEDVIDAIRGKESPWKLIRCSPELSGRGSRLFLLLTNPATFSMARGHIDVDDLCHSVEQDVKNGVIWAYMDSAASGSFDANIVSQCQDGKGGCNRCSIRLWSSNHFDLTEYDADGEIKRINKVRPPKTGDGFYLNYVTEYYA